MPKISWRSLLATGDLRHYLLIDFCNRYGLHQLVNSPTRGSSILDVVLTNGHNIVQNVVVNDPLVNCDHRYISFFIAAPLVSHLNSSYKVWWYNFNKADYAGIASVLKLIDWRVFFNSCCNINDYWYTWWALMISLVDRFLPIVRHRNRAKLRLPNYIRNLLSRRNKTWRKYQSSELSSNYNIYKRLCSRCKASLSNFFINKEKKIFACRNIKQIFTSVNNRLRPTQRFDRLLLTDGSFTFDECQIANAFSEEFQSNYSYGCGSDSPLSFASRTAEHSEDPLFDYNIVYLALRCAKNSAAGPDHLPGRFYCSLTADLALSLSIIFQQSFYPNHIPDMWRMVMVRHVFKKDLEKEPLIKSLSV